MRLPFDSTLSELAARALPLSLALGVLLGCAGGSGDSNATVTDPPLAEAPVFSLRLRVIDEDGLPVAGAAVETVTQGAGVPPAPVSTSADGTAEIGDLRAPQLFLIRAEGFLPEPVVLGRGDGDLEVEVRLIARTGAGGATRLAFHFAGDVMLGRRYLEPTLDFTAVVSPGDGGESARAVVSPVGPLFRAADVRSVNLETVVGELALEDAYPKKRFLLQSPQEVLDLLRFLEVDLVTLGNNHLRDWLDAGVAMTTAHLDGGGIPHVGAGVTEAEAGESLILERAGMRVGFLSYTSVNGDFVNDSLPPPEVEAPADLDESDRWQYEERLFGFLGENVDIPPGFYRIRAVWDLFREAERMAYPDAEIAALWQSASYVFPELQDWVARRDHGGANPYDRDQVVQDVAALRTAGCTFVVVQYHSGFQFVEFKSSLAESAAHTAIDAGADLVVCHHPHVLQGLEWYRGKLIAYSLGNFVFDQDFLSTFASVVLRVVMDEGGLVEARLLPIVLDDYRPTPIVGEEAASVLQSVEASSVLPFRGERIDGTVRRVERASPEGVESAVFIRERNSARIDRPSAAAASSGSNVELFSETATGLEGTQLTRSRSTSGALDGVLFGFDLFGWGSFEDVGADDFGGGGIHWITNDTYKRIEVLADAPSGVRALRLRRTESNSGRTFARPRARITRLRHRYYTEAGAAAVPADGEASYSVRFQGRFGGASAQTLLRFDVYRFDDTDPTADPDSTLLRRVEVPFALPADDQWHEALVDVPASVFADLGDLEANAALFYVGLGVPASGVAVLLVDDLEFIEWRRAEALPDAFYPVVAVRAESPSDQRTIVLERRGG